MVKLNCINQEACLINWNHETYDIKQQFIVKFLKHLLNFSQILLNFLLNSVFH